MISGRSRCFRVNERRSWRGFQTFKVRQQLHGHTETANASPSRSFPNISHPVCWRQIPTRSRTRSRVVSVVMPSSAELALAIAVLWWPNRKSTPVLVRCYMAGICCCFLDLTKI